MGHFKMRIFAYAKPIQCIDFQHIDSSAISSLIGQWAQTANRLISVMVHPDMGRQSLPYGDKQY